MCKNIRLNKKDIKDIKKDIKRDIKKGISVGSKHTESKEVDEGKKEVRSKRVKVVDRVLLIDEENAYHDWILHDIGQRYKLPIRVITADKKKVSRLKYTSILDRSEIVYIKDSEKEINKVLGDIVRINLQKRLLVISVGSKYARERIEKGFKEKKVELFPKLDTFQEKREYLERVIGRWGIECQNRDVEMVLKRNMVRNVSSWDDVKMTWDILSYRGEVFTLDIVDELYPDEEFYRLDDFILGLLAGKWKKKATVMMNYYLEVRGYSASWLLRKIREEYLTIGLFYQAYRGGVMIMPEVSGRVTDLVNYLGWDNGLRLVDFKDFEQERYLEYIKEMPYGHYVSLNKYILGVDVEGSEEGLYRMIEDIKKVRGEYDVDWGKTNWWDKKGRR